LSQDELIVVDNFDLKEIKTKQIVDFMKKFELKKCLILVDELNQNLIRSSNNIKDVKVLRNEGVNVYDLLKYKNLIIKKNTISKVQEALVR